MFGPRGGLVIDTTVFGGPTEIIGCIWFGLVKRVNVTRWRGVIIGVDVACG